MLTEYLNSKPNYQGDVLAMNQGGPDNAPDVVKESPNETFKSDCEQYNDSTDTGDSNTSINRKRKKYGRDWEAKIFDDFEGRNGDYDTVRAWFLDPDNGFEIDLDEYSFYKEMQVYYDAEGVKYCVPDIIAVKHYTNASGKTVQAPLIVIDCKLDVNVDFTKGQWNGRAADSLKIRSADPEGNRLLSKATEPPGALHIELEQGDELKDNRAWVKVGDTGTGSVYGETKNYSRTN